VASLEKSQKRAAEQMVSLYTLTLCHNRQLRHFRLPDLNQGALEWTSLSPEDPAMGMGMGTGTVTGTSSSSPLPLDYPNLVSP